jgi:predicted MFS family arabinose efflux permease
MKKETYPKGHFLSYGLAIGIPLGIPIGLALGNIALGPAIGAGIGLVLGLFFEKKYEKEGKIRPLTKIEKERQKRNLWWVLGLAIIVFLGVLSGYVFFN